ncbi:MAG: AMMECR1 family protein [Ignavibacteriales bacterium]|nr:AMMECR1 family protein [Ignavibacteriales bacterium]
MRAARALGAARRARAVLRGFRRRLGRHERRGRVPARRCSARSRPRPDGERRTAWRHDSRRTIAPGCWPRPAPPSPTPSPAGRRAPVAAGRGLRAASRRLRLVPSRRRSSRAASGTPTATSRWPRSSRNAPWRRPPGTRVSTPCRRRELARCVIEISVLGPITEVRDPGEIVVGRDGLIAEQGWRRGLLLPQVAVEYGWDLEAFLSRTCAKAGLPPDAWKRGATISGFEAEVFDDADAGWRSA